MMTLVAIITLLAVILAAITDVRTARIPNWLTLPLFVFGLLRGGIFGGWTGFVDSVAAGFLYVFLTFLFEFTQGKPVGGGDIKLVAAIGSCLGTGYFTPYFAGMWLARAGWGIAVRFKLFRYSVVDFIKGFWFELYSGQDLMLGRRNFGFMQRAAVSFGLDPDGVYIPPPFWLIGGVAAVIFFNLLMGG